MVQMTEMFQRKHSFRSDFSLCDSGMTSVVVMAFSSPRCTCVSVRNVVLKQNGYQKDDSLRSGKGLPRKTSRNRCVCSMAFS